jgi:hypothetical protein
MLDKARQGSGTCPCGIRRYVLVCTIRLQGRGRSGTYRELMHFPSDGLFASIARGPFAGVAMWTEACIAVGRVMVRNHEVTIDGFALTRGQRPTCLFLRQVAAFPHPKVWLASPVLYTLLHIDNKREPKPVKNRS